MSWIVYIRQVKAAFGFVTGKERRDLLYLTPHCVKSSFWAKETAALPDKIWGAGAIGG